MKEVYIGIDVGKNGGMGIIIDNGKKSLKRAVRYVPDHNILRDVLENITDSTHGYPQVYCLIEKVHSMPKQGVKSTFSFGENFGFWKGLLCGLDIYYKEVTPQSWMKHFNIPKFQSKKDRKNYIKALAHKKFPSVGMNLYVSDACMIAQYCKDKFYDI
jgi:crossover junction endodeoxyribonuclease RuvC